jgi:hypothetical protein
MNHLEDLREDGIIILQDFKDKAGEDLYTTYVPNRTTDIIIIIIIIIIKDNGLPSPIIHVIPF